MMEMLQNLWNKFRYYWKYALLLLGFLGWLKADAQTLESSMLWRVEGPGIETSYLFGTIHVLPKSAFELKQKVTDALDDTKLLVMELDMTDPGMQMQMMQAAKMKDGVTLDQLLDQPTYRRLDTLLQQGIGASVVFVNGFKPFVVASMLIGRLIEGEQASFEMALVAEAKKREMSVKGLETVAQQMAVFDSIPYESQASDLAEMINEEPRMKKLYAEMIDLYRQEKITELYEVLSREMDNAKEQAHLLDERNRSWIPLIAKWSAEQPAMYAVGAGHLAGEQGVIALLRNEGYTVTPIR